MARKKRQGLPQNPLVVGLSALIAVLLITATSFNTPLVSFAGAGGETASLNFSMVGIPLLGLLALLVLILRVRKK